MLRRLIVIILLAVLLWGGYWAVGAWGLKKATRSWLEARRDEGWVAEAQDISLRGFPNRFDLELDQIELADPRTGWAWSAPFFQTLALSYKPYHVIAVWPNAQKLQTPYELLTITSERMRGSLVLTPDTNLALQRASFELDEILVISDAGWESAISMARIATRTAPPEAPDPLTHQISIKANAWKLPSPLLAALDNADMLPDQLDALEADVTVRFDAPWGRNAIERERPQPRHIKITLAEARWGQMALKLAGELDVDESGLPTGKLLVKATNWQEILDLGVSSGLVPEQLKGTIETALSMLSQLAGSPKTLDIPISFSDGQIWAGPAPLGPAPVLRLR